MFKLLAIVAVLCATFCAGKFATNWIQSRCVDILFNFEPVNPTKEKSKEWQYYDLQES